MWQCTFSNGSAQRRPLRSSQTSEIPRTQLPHCKQASVNVRLIACHWVWAKSLPVPRPWAEYELLQPNCCSTLALRPCKSSYHQQHRHVMEVAAAQVVAVVKSSTWTLLIKVRGLQLSLFTREARCWLERIGHQCQVRQYGFKLFSVGQDLTQLVILITCNPVQYLHMYKVLKRVMN